MSNRVNNWEELLELANKDLKKRGIEIIVGKDDEESSSYFLNIAYKTYTDTYASGYYKDELSELINDAWVHARAKAKQNIRDKVIQYIKSNGKIGAEEQERYVDLETPIILNNIWAIYQVCYFTNEDCLQVYCLDNDKNGQFYDWDDVNDTTQCQIMTALSK